MPLRARLLSKGVRKLKECGKPKHGPIPPARKSQDICEFPVRCRQETWEIPIGGGRYERHRQAEWDARELRTASTKVRRETYEIFRRLCRARKTTPYAVLQGFLLAYVDHFGAATAAEVRHKRP